MKQVIILGGLGDGMVVAETISLLTNCKVVGFLNDSSEKGTLIGGKPVLGTLRDWQHMPEDSYFIAALHKIRKAEERHSLLLSLEIPSHRWISITHPTSYIAKDAKIGRGVYIGPFVTIQPSAIIQDHVSMRAGVNVGHDVIVEPYCYLGPNVTLCGRTTLKAGVHMGPNSCVVDQCTISEYSVIGGCSLITKNVPARSLMVGVPAERRSRDA